MKHALAAAIFLAAGAVAADDGTWSGVDRALGRDGKDLPGEVRKYAFPRTDLRVTVGDITVQPALALTSWAAFRRSGKDGTAMAMGDLVLLSGEVNPVITRLQDGGLEVTALHNHLLGENPQVLYVHFQGTGDAGKLAGALRAALAKTGTPIGPPTAPPTVSSEEEKTLVQVQSALGRKGSMAGRVLQVSVARKETIQEGAMEIPPSMGMAIAINLQIAGPGVATTGDFVLTAEEVNPVIRALQAHGIDVTALHSHMLRETPRLFFMHFWGVGSPEKIGAGLQAALANVATKP